MTFDTSLIAAATLACCAAAPALAYPGQGIPNPRYPDGTGNDVVEQLNNAQLDRNYHGPIYYRGQEPAAAPVILAYPPGFPAAGEPSRPPYQPP